MQDVFDNGVGHDGHQYGILEAEDQLHRGSFGDGGGVGVQDELKIDQG